MTQEELDFIKDSFSQIIEDIAGNPDWHEAARAVAADLGTLEKELGESVAPSPSDVDEAAEEYCSKCREKGFHISPYSAFKVGAKWRDAETQRYFQAQIEQELKRLEDPSYEGPEKDVEIAAELWALDHIQETEHRDITKAFCAGAEWMAGQGHTVDGTFHHSCGYPSVIELKTYLREYEGTDVIVQIRKKQ